MKEEGEGRRESEGERRKEKERERNDDQRIMKHHPRRW